MEKFRRSQDAEYEKKLPQVLMMEEVEGVKLDLEVSQESIAELKANIAALLKQMEGYEKTIESLRFWAERYVYNAKQAIETGGE